MAARPSSEEQGGGRGLDFFAHTESACQQVQQHVRITFGEACAHGLQRSVARSLGFVHDLPLQTLNDRLKHCHFVDPKPLDDHLTEMIHAILAWLEWLTRPYWIVEVLHRIGSISPEGRAWLLESSRAPQAQEAQDQQDAGLARDPLLAPALPQVVAIEGLLGECANADLDLEQMGRFTYPMALKLRDLQAMVHPFMDVRSTHHIPGLHAMVAELIRGLLHLFQLVRSWDDRLCSVIERIAEAHAAGAGSPERITALLELCAIIEMDTFEAAHRLNRVNVNVFKLSPDEIEGIRQQLPSYVEQRILRGPPSTALDHGLHGAYGETAKGGRALRGSVSLAEPGSGATSLEQVRSECMEWWRQRRFAHSAPTRIFATALLTHLVDHHLHPDPYVTEMLPRVLERLFGYQISSRCFMNRLLPSLGGYVDDGGTEVRCGEGLVPFSDPARCAKALLVFLERWSDLVLGAEEEDLARATERNKSPGKARSKSNTQENLRHRRIELLDKLIQQIDETGRADGLTEHGYYNEQEVADLLEGSSAVDGVAVTRSEDSFKINDATVRSWDLLSDHYHDTMEQLRESDRDLGPYMHLDLSRPQEVAKLLGPMPENSWTIVNPTSSPAISSAFSLEDRDGAANPQGCSDASMTFGLRLADWPPELDPTGEGASSTFVKFFAQEGRSISRLGLQGLPPLPWSFGTDERNTLIMDVSHKESVAPFHSLFAGSDSQPGRAVVVALGDTTSKSYVVCPKYQPLQVRNGDRIFCHQWSCEVRLRDEAHHRSALSLLMEDGDIYDVPFDGCHVGAGSRSPKLEYQPFFPETKLAPGLRAKDMAPVHIVFRYQEGMNRWTLIDHSPDPLGALLMLRPGIAYPLSEGLRLKLGPLILEVKRESP